MTSSSDLSTIHRHRYRLAPHRSEARTQTRHRRLLGRTDQSLRPGIGGLDTAPRHVVAPGGGRPGLRAGEHLLLLRPDARHRGHARRAARAGGRNLRRPGPLLRRGARQQRRSAAGDDQVVRHQLPLHRSRDRARDQVHAEPGQGALRAERGSRARHSGAPGRHRPSHLPAAEQGASTAAGAPIERLQELVPIYSELLSLLADNGAQWVQLDEPALVTDISPDAPALAEAVYNALGAAEQPACHLRRHLLR